MEQRQRERESAGPLNAADHFEPCSGYARFVRRHTPLNNRIEQPYRPAAHPPRCTQKGEYKMNNQTIRNLLVFLLLLSLLVITPVADAKTKETPHYDVVAEFVRSLGAIYRIQQTAQKEFQEEGNPDNPVSKLIAGIRSSTRFKLELSSSIGALKRMTLKKPFDELIPITIYFYKKKIELHEETIKIAKTFIDAGSVPKADVDYSKMVARMPELTASIEYIDEGIFQSMVLVFALLIDEKPDSEGHMSHLIITTEQKQKLIDTIDTLFGESLNNENKNWTVSSAALLKAYLLKDYKCKDEWQNERKASNNEEYKKQ